MKAFRALFWKEYRQQVALVVAIIALCFLLQLSATLMHLWNSHLPLPFFAIAMLATALYTAGAAAILFAREHEERTYVILRSLPISGPFLAWGKISWLLASTLFVAAATALVAGVWALALNDTSGMNIVLGACGVGVIEGLCWGLFWSSRTKKQLNALLCTFFSAAISMQLCTTLYVYVYQIASPSSPDIYAQAWWFRLLVAVPVGLVGLYGSMRWLTKTERYDYVDASNKVKSQSRGMLARFPFFSLCWITFRQSRALILTAWIIALPFGIWIIWDIMRGIIAFAAHQSDPYNLGDFTSEKAYTLAVILPLFLIVYCGSVFFADHKENGTRLLANCGVSPAKIWWSRMLVFGSAFLPLGLALICVTIFAWPHLRPRVFFLSANDLYYYLYNYDTISERMALYYVPVLLTMAFFCIGQMVSLFLRSGIVGIVATGMAGIMFLFTLAMFYCFLGDQVIWVAIAIPILCLVASRLRVGDWLRTRDAFRIWIRPLLVVLIPLGCVLVMIPSYRIWTVPNINMGYHLDETNLNKPVDQAEYQLTLSNYRYNIETGWNRYKDHSLNEYLKLKYNEGLITSDTDRKKYTAEFFKEWIQKFENDDKLYDTPPLLEMNRTIFGYEQRIVRTGILPEEQVKDPRRIRANLFAVLPWEKIRFLKLLNVQFQNTSQSIVLMENALFDKSVPFEDALEQTWIASQWGYGYARGIDLSLRNAFWGSPLTGGIVFNRELNRRISLLEAALKLWYLEHGTLPESLDALKGVYVKEIPKVPGFEFPFVYCPHPNETTVSERDKYYWIRQHDGKDVPNIYAPIPREFRYKLRYYGDNNIVRFLHFAVPKPSEEPTLETEASEEATP